MSPPVAPTSTAALDEIEHRPDVRVFDQSDHDQPVVLHPGELVEIRLPEVAGSGCRWEIRQRPPWLIELGDLFDARGAAVDAELPADPFGRALILKVAATEPADEQRLRLMLCDDGHPVDGSLADGFELRVRVSTRRMRDL